MSNVSALFKLFFINDFKQLFAGPSKTNSKFKPWQIIGFICLYILLVGLFTLYGYLVIEGCKGLNRLDLIPPMMILIFALISLTYGLFQVISILYFDKSNRLFLPLPISGIELFVAKTLSLWCSSILFGCIFLIGPIILTLIMVPLSIVQMVIFCITAISISLFPIVLLEIVIMLLMNFTKALYNKRIVQIIGGAIGLLVYFFIVFNSSSSRNDEFNALINLIESIDLNFTGLLYPLNFAINGVRSTIFGEQLINFGIYVLCLATVSAIAIAIANKVYIKSLVAYSFSGSSRKALKVNDKTYQQRSIFGQLIKKELSLIFSSPTYIMQLVVPMYLFGAVIVISIVAQGLQENGLVEVLNVLISLIPMNVKCFILMGIIGVFSFIDYSSSVMISKDGYNAYWMKVIPIIYSTQLFAKIVTCLLLKIPAFILLLIIGLLLKVNGIYLVLILISGFCVQFIMHAAMLAYDANKPYLTWTREIQVVKNNMHVFIGMLIAIGITVASIGIFALVLVDESFLTSIVSIYTMLVLAISYGMYRWYIKSSQKWIFNF